MNAPASGFESRGRPTIQDVATKAGVSTMSVSRVLNGARVSAELSARVRQAVEALNYVPGSRGRGPVTGGRPTIQDVAKKAGVSMMSVSRVLNGAPVGAETSARVRQAVEELNYIPNQAARKLKERLPRHNIAFLFDTPEAAVFGEMAGAGFAEAVASNAELVFIRVHADRDPARLRRTLANFDIEGAILSPPFCDDAMFRNALSNAGIRIVAIGCDDRDLPHSTVGIDDTRAAYQLTQHLLELGHRRIGFLDGSPGHRSSARRRAGYEAALIEQGIAPDEPLHAQGEYIPASAVERAERCVVAMPRPTAILAANGDMAAAVMRVAESRGIAVPDSLSVCGFEDGGTAAMASPRLTTVSQPIGAMAEWAVRQLVRELSAIARGAEPDVRKIVLHHTIVHRGSDAPPPAVSALRRPELQRLPS